jgi:3-hydroxyisobutyrate dehydrogenase-like beta-hydroxyacid dehydrogenase
VSVAVIGTGRMGGAMVGRLSGSGYEVVVYNRTTARARQVADATGALVAGTAGEAAARADVVLVSLADDAAVEAAYAGPDGLAAGLRDGAVVLETSTVSPATVRGLEPLVAKRGADLLDAPVSGSVPIVERGELTFMVGGDAAALDRVGPVLARLASRVFHLGALGSGAIMKLAVNAVVLGLNQSLAEALVLAEKAGLDRAKVYEVFANSAVAAPFVHYKRDSFERPDEAPVAFMLDLVAKDLSLIDELAHTVGARMEQLAAERRVVADAQAAGYGGRDLSALAEFLRSA